MLFAIAIISLTPVKKIFGQKNTPDDFFGCKKLFRPGRLCPRFGFGLRKSALNASLSRCLRLLFTSDGRFFVMFFTAQITDYAVSRTLSLKSAKRVIKRFVFTDSDSGHILNPPLPKGSALKAYRLYQTENLLSSVFAHNNFTEFWHGAV